MPTVATPATRSAAKLTALADTLEALNKQFGRGAIMPLGDGFAVPPVAVIPTGSVTLDRALGVGGYPRGRIIELFGNESSGKTTVALHAIAQCQAMGGVAAFVDAEHGLDLAYARRLGVRVDELLVAQPDHGEQALEVAEQLTRTGAVDLIIIDSVAALVPRVELEGAMGDEHSGMLARLMSQALRKLTACVSRSGTVLIFINQTRARLGVHFGNAETTTGGNALKFYSSVRCEIRRVGNLKDGEAVVGSRTKVKVLKNKVAPPFREAEFDVSYRTGIHRAAEVLDLALELGLVRKAGHSHSVDGVAIGNGREAAIEWLTQHPRELEALAAATVHHPGPRATSR